MRIASPYLKSVCQTEISYHSKECLDQELRKCKRTTKLEWGIEQKYLGLIADQYFTWETQINKNWPLLLY